MTRWLAIARGGLGICLRGRCRARRPRQRRRQSRAKAAGGARASASCLSGKGRGQCLRRRLQRVDRRRGPIRSPVRPAARWPSSSVTPRASCRSTSIRRAATGPTRLRSAANCDSWGSPPASARPSRAVARRPATCRRRAARRSGRRSRSSAEWRPDGICNSACVWALLGGKVRHVPPSARLGVHSGKMTMMRQVVRRPRAAGFARRKSLHKTRAAEGVANTRRYIARDGHRHGAHGCGPEDTARRYPLSQPRRDCGFRHRPSRVRGDSLVLRPDFQRHPYVSKWIVEARGPERKDYRVSVVMMQVLERAARAQCNICAAWRATKFRARPRLRRFSIGEHERSI